MILRSALVFLSLATAFGAAGLDQLQRSFERPPDDARIMMRWWWFGPAVTKSQLEREMKLMKEGGIGGFEVQPVYPVALDDVKAGIRNLPFLSGEFIDALRFTALKARELGLRMDLTLGSGWPYGGPQIPVAQAAGRLRIDRVRTEGKSRRVVVPWISEGEQLIAAFDAKTLREVNDIRDGVLYLPAGASGPAEILFFIASRTGMMVKRPAVGAEGFVLDHYDRSAVDNFLNNVAGREMQAFTGGAEPPYAVFCDSLELSGSNWTGDLLPEFQKRRGYDLRPYLPALAVDIGPETADIRHDFGRTLTELITERFVAPLQEWARKNRTRFRIQGYGSPPVALYSYAYTDLPEGEGAQWKSFSTSRWASSASHMLGRPITSSETWTWLHSPSFRATPLDMKVEADRHFLQGINQLIGHGWPYTAEGAQYPGWRFYAAAVFNEKNPWWNVMPDVALYLQRVSHMLRQGAPANDVALYLSNSDAWSRFANGRAEMNGTLSQLLGRDTISQVLDAGFNFDFLDDGLLERNGRVEKGALVFGDSRYRVVLLSGVERIPARTMRVFEEFARAGGIVIATRRRPALAPGLKAGDAERKEVAEISRRLFEGSSPEGVFLESEAELGKTLASRLRPDVSFSPAAPEVGFVHRKADAGEIYFLANTANTRQTVKAAFRVEGMQPEWWDPRTGRVQPAEVLERPAGTTVVTVDLEPYGSRLLVFTRRTLPRPGAVGSHTASIDLSSGWRVTFGPDSKPVQMDTLRSWTEDEETLYFSGLATYEKDVTVAESMLRSGWTLRLDFGEGKPAPQAGPRLQALLDAPVRDAAVVYVNGRRAGSAWCPPYSVDVTGMLKPGQNRIRIEVGNTAINYMAGHALPDYRLLNLKYGVRFEPQDMKDLRPLPSGLLGAVQLVASSEPRP
jgi:hypothetical protein